VQPWSARVQHKVAERAPAGGRRKPAVALGTCGNLRRGTLVRPRAQVPQLVLKGAPHDRTRALH